MNMLFITDEQELDLKVGPSVVYFYASWFLLQSKLVSLLTAIEQDAGCKFYAVDVEAFPGYIAKYKLASLPTIKIIKDEGFVAKTLTKISDIESIAQEIHDVRQ